MNEGLDLYTDYHDLRKSLPFKDAVNLHEEMPSEIATDKTVMEIYTKICGKAACYSEFMSKEDKVNMAPSRTACHDSLINSFDQRAECTVTFHCRETEG